jgi:T5SS/PEP-CTERM-associated repeat protein
MSTVASIARALAAVAISALIAPVAEAGGGPPPGPPEITVELSESFLESLAVFDVDEDGTLEPSERVVPDPIQESPGSLQEISNAVLGGARGTARQDANVSLAGTVLTVTASGDCASQVTLTGDAERDRLQASEAEQTFLLAFDTNAPARFAFSADVSVTGGASDLPIGTRASVSFNQAGVDIQARDGSDDPQSQSASVNGELPPGGGGIGGGCRTSALRFGDPIPLATARWRLTLTVELLEAGDVFVWVGPQAGAFGEDRNWDPEGPAATGVPSFVPGERSDTALFRGGRTRVDLGGLAATSRAARGTAAQCAGPISQTVGRVVLDSTNAFEPVNGTLALNALSLDEASLTLEDNALLELRDAALCARHAQVGARGRPSIALVAGPGGVLESLGRLSVGLGGDGTLRIQDGGIASSEEVRLGDGQRVGSAVVSDATWQTGNLAVGFRSTGELLVENAGLLESEGGFVDRDLDDLGAERGTATVRGAGSRWNLDELVVGGFGLVEATEGGRIETPNQAETGRIRIGDFGDPGEATLLVNDGGELLTQSLDVGSGGTGRLVVAEAFDRNPRVEADFALFVGSVLGGRGVVQVIGDPSTDGVSLVADEIQVGASEGALGELNVDFGGKILTGTNAFVGTDGGRGVVRLLGGAIGTPDLTSWQVSESLNVGGASRPATGTVIIRDALLSVGTPSTPGSVFVDAGGAIVASGTASRLAVRGGLVTNDGLIVGPLTIDGRYDPASTGTIVSTIAGLPPSPLRLVERSPAGAIAALGAARKPPAPAQGPVTFTGDAELGGTLVLQFVNGFAPSQGSTFEIVQAAGNVIGQFADVVVQGLAPGALFEGSVQNGVLALTSLTDAVALPAVSLKAKVKLKEKKKKGGTVTFKRTGDTAHAIVVQYQVGGTAANGIDYQQLPGAVEIPAGRKSAKVRLLPFRDGLAEATETIEIEILPGDGYAPALVTQAAIDLLDAD